MSTTLTREAIVAAGIDLADRDGLDVVSMRRLADTLGCGTMSLYNHVGDKDDVLAGMVDEVVGQVDLPAPTDDWRRAATALAQSLRATLTAHPWACDLWQTAWPGPHRTRLMEEVLGTFRRGGFSRRMAHHALHAVDLYVVGYVHQAARFTIGLDDPEASMARFLDQTPPDEFPYTHEHVAHHADPDNGEDDFAFMLGLLLDGLERHHDG